MSTGSESENPLAFSPPGGPRPGDEPEDPLRAITGGPPPAALALAHGWLLEGELLSEIHRRLVARGTAAADANAVGWALARDRARFWTAAGTSRAEIVRRLTEHGLSPEAAADAARDGAGDVRSAVARAGGVGRGVVAAMFVGVGLMAAGFLLYVGNATGLFPTFPFAGGLVSAVGMAVMVVAGQLAGWEFR